MAIKSPEGKKLSVLAVIPARKGSKGVARKNMRMLDGKPLLAHSILSAKASRYIDRIVVTTDDEEMRRAALEHGAEAPFLRPANLAADLTPDYPVLEHCLTWLRRRKKYEPDLIVYLLPTGALRSVEDVDQSIELLAKNPGADSVRTVNEPPKSPYKMWAPGKRFMKPLLKLKGRKDAHHAPRQTLPAVYQTNPYAFVLWPRTLKRYRSLIGSKVLPLLIKRPVVDLDTEADFASAEWLLHSERSRTIKRQ